MRRQACSSCLAKCSMQHGAEDEQKYAIPPRNPSFMKKMAGADSSDMLPIPSSFVKSHAKRIGTSVTLEGPSTEKWIVAVDGSFSKHNVHLKLGWRKFVKDHLLQLGDHLLFILSGDSYFQVEVYDESGCQKLSAIDAINSSKHLGSNLTILESNATTPESYKKSADLEADKNPNANVPGGSSALRLPSRKKRERSDSEKVENSPKKHLISLSSSECDSQNVNLPVDNDEVATEGVSLLPPHKLDHGVVISQRRPVTEQEKSQTLQAAQALRPSNPHTLITMAKANVYKGFLLALPKQFVKDNMPSASREVTLVNKAGHKWAVKWLVHNDVGTHGNFSGGWRAFAIDHRLEEFDVCVFEVVDKKECEIVVHIFRVLGGQEEEDSAPYTPSVKVGKNVGRLKKSQDFYEDVEEQDFSIFHRPRSFRNTPVRTAAINRTSQPDKKPSTSTPRGDGEALQRSSSAAREEPNEGDDARPKGISMLEKVGHGLLRCHFVIDGSLEPDRLGKDKIAKHIAVEAC